MINDISDARDKLIRYRGSNTTVSVNYSSIPITFLNVATTGDGMDDQMSITWIWRSDSGLEEFYTLLRDSINERILFRIGRDEFNAELVDTTSLEAGEDISSLSSEEFTITLTMVDSMGVLVESGYKSAILALSVSPDEFSRITDHPHPDFGAHITLLYCPGGFSDDEMDSIRTRIADLSIPPFDVEVSGRVLKWGPDDNNEYAYVAEVIPDHNIVSLREKLIHVVLDVCGDEKIDVTTFPDFKPHVTIKYSPSIDENILARPTKWMQSDVSIYNKDDNPTVSIPLVSRSEAYTSLSYISDHEKIVGGVRYSSKWQEKRSGISDLIISSLINRIRQTLGVDPDVTRKLSKSVVSIWSSPKYAYNDIFLVNPSLGDTIISILGTTRNRDVNDLISEFECEDIAHILLEDEHV